MAANLAHEIRNPSFGADSALDEHSDTVGKLLGLLEIVGREEDGHALPAEVGEHLVDGFPGAGIDPDGRLVENDDADL